MQIVRLLMVCVLSLEILLQPDLARSSENWFIPKSITYENRLPVNHFRYKFTQEFANQYYAYATSQLSLLSELSKDQIDEVEANYQFYKLLLDVVKASIDIYTLRSMTKDQIERFLNNPDFIQAILSQLDRMGIIPSDEDSILFKESILLIVKIYCTILKEAQEKLPKNVPFTTDMVTLTKKIDTPWLEILVDIAGITNSIVHAVQFKKNSNVMYSHLIAHEFIKAHVCPKWEDKSSIFYKEGQPLSCDYQNYESFISSTYNDYANKYGGTGFPGVNALNSEGKLIRYSADGTFKLYIKIPNKKGELSLEDWYNSLDWTDYAILSPGNYDVSLATSVIERYYGLNNATNYSIILLDGNERVLNKDSYNDLKCGDKIKITTPFHNQQQREEILAYDFHYKVKDISIYKVNKDLSEELITGTKYGIEIFKEVILKNGENIFKEEIKLAADDTGTSEVVTRYFFIKAKLNAELLSSCKLLFLPAILASAAADSSAVIDGINQKQWFAERAQPEGVEDWSAVDFSTPYVTLYQDRTDNGPALTSIGLKKVSGKKLKITRTALMHSHISYSYLGKDEFFTGAMGIFESDSSERKGVSALLGLPPLCQVKYMDYEYQGDWDNFILDDHNNPSNFVPSVWDAEFKETFIYNPASGEASYEVNGNRVEAQCKPLNSEFLRIYISTYGWWTGHYTKIKSVQVKWID